MSTFHRPEHIGTNLLLGAAVLAIGISMSVDPQALFSSKSQSQFIVTPAQLIGTSSMTNDQIEQARRDRCTPGFSCRTSAPTYSRVSRKRALQFAFAMGQGVNR